jgi:hypothetical protein
MGKDYPNALKLSAPVIQFSAFLRPNWPADAAVAARAIRTVALLSRNCGSCFQGLRQTHANPIVRVEILSRSFTDLTCISLIDDIR